jgi:hypothetical protein
MNNKFDFVVIGNNIASLVSAIELSKEHKIVFINPTSNIGGHFSGININDDLFDIGMNYLEFSSFKNQSENIEDYDVTKRNDVGRFFSLVKKYIENKIEIYTVSNLKTQIESKFSNDMMIANQFDILNELNSTTKNKIRKELKAILDKKKSKLHASLKSVNENEFLEATYKNVSIANHGITFHETFIEPFCLKSLGISSSEIPALFHRLIWAPLFYPETLHDVLDGNDVSLSTELHYPQKGYFSCIIEELYKDLRNPNIVYVNKKLDRVDLKDNETIKIKTSETEYFANKIIWGMDLASLSDSKISFKKASLTFLFAHIDSCDVLNKFSTINNCSSSDCIFRVTNQGFLSNNELANHKFIFEMNTEFLLKKGITTDEKILSHVNEYLQKYKITSKNIDVNEYQIKHFKDAINLPTLTNYYEFNKLQALVYQRFPEIELVGSASSYLSTSFNDQVVQGLKLGLKYSNLSD